MKKTIIPFSKHFGYLGEILNDIKDGKPLRVKEIYQSGSRKSAKTTNDENFLALLPFTDRKIKVIEIKDTKSDIEETIYAETIQAMQTMGAPIHSSRKQPLRLGSFKTSYSFFSLYQPNSKKVSLSGLSSLRMYEYVIVLIDEAYDISADDFADLSEAIRGCEQVLWIFTMNPWSAGHWLVKKMHSIKPFNIAKMRESYDDFLFDKTSKRIVHYSCYLGNNFLTQEDKDRLAKDAVNRPIGLRDTVLYGAPGYEEGAIYADYIGKVESPSFTPYEFSGGLDVGYKKDSTAAMFVATDWAKSKRMVMGEWTHSNAFGVYKDVEQQCLEICRFYLEMMTEMQRRYALGRLFRMKISVDCQDIAFIQDINKIKARFGEQGQYLEFIPCKKIPINMRIDKTISEMNAGIMQVDWARCPTLRKEMEMSQWDESVTKTEKSRKDGNDHCINALEYEQSMNWNRG